MEKSKNPNVDEMYIMFNEMQEETDVPFTDELNVPVTDELNIPVINEMNIDSNDSAFEECNLEKLDKKSPDSNQTSSMECNQTSSMECNQPSSMECNQPSSMECNQNVESPNNSALPSANKLQNKEANNSTSSKDCCDIKTATCPDLLWKNDQLSCWVDSTMHLLIISKTVQQLSGTMCVIKKLVDDYIVANNAYLQGYKSVEEAYAELEKIRKFVYKFLYVKMKFELGMPDSAFIALMTLLNENLHTKSLFLVKYNLLFSCSNCNRRKVLFQHKTVITVSTVEVFDPVNVVSQYKCPGCLVTKQKKRVQYLSIPNCLFFHFENGLGTGKTEKGSIPMEFILKGKEYKISGVLLLLPGTIKHFVACKWNPDSETWVWYDDSASSAIIIPRIVLPVSLENIHILMYESDNEVEVLNEDIAEFNSNLCESELNGRPMDYSVDENRKSEGKVKSNELLTQQDIHYVELSDSDRLPKISLSLIDHSYASKSDKIITPNAVVNDETSSQSISIPSLSKELITDVQDMPMIQEGICDVQDTPMIQEETCTIQDFPMIQEGLTGVQEMPISQEGICGIQDTLLIKDELGSLQNTPLLHEGISGPQSAPTVQGRTAGAENVPLVLGDISHIDVRLPTNNNRITMSFKSKEVIIRIKW